MFGPIFPHNQRFITLLSSFFPVPFRQQGPYYQNQHVPRFRTTVGIFFEDSCDPTQSGPCLFGRRRLPLAPGDGPHPLHPAVARYLHLVEDELHKTRGHQKKRQLEVPPCCHAEIAAPTQTPPPTDAPSAGHQTRMYGLQGMGVYIEGSLVHYTHLS